MATTTEPKKALPGPEPESEPPQDKARMTFTAHLGELRWRLIRSAIAIIVGFVGCYVFSDELIVLISYPLSPIQNREAPDETPPAETATQQPAEDSAAPPPGEPTPADLPTARIGEIEWIVLTPLEYILVKLRIAAYFGIFIMFPYIVYQICAFVFPGLKAKERKAVKIFLFGSTFLGLAGFAVAYFGVLPIVLDFLMEFTPDFIKPQLWLSATIPIILKAILAFGIAFQFPMAVLVLVYLGIMTPESLKAYRKIVIIGIFVVGALLTPPEPITQILMAMPLVALYEVSIWLSYFIVRKREQADAR